MDMTIALFERKRIVDPTKNIVQKEMPFQMRVFRGDERMPLQMIVELDDSRNQTMGR